MVIQGKKIKRIAIIIQLFAMNFISAAMGWNSDLTVILFTIIFFLQSLESVLNVFKDISGLTLQGLTYFIQGRKTNRLGASGF